MPNFRTLLALLLVLAPTQAFAWGQEGHSIVAEIAQRRLTPTALGAAKKILGGEVSLASVSSWADDVRGPHDHPESYNWHFVDIPLDVPTYDAARDCKADPAKGDCVIAEIGRAEQAMTCGATPAERLDNLRYLIHFVGDVHQPMHTVLENRGENDVDVTVAFPGAINNNNQMPANLHAVWDSVLIQRTVYDWGAYVNRLEGGWLQQNPGPMTDLDPVHWAEEAHPLAKAAVVAEGAVLDQGYYTTQIAVVDEQLGRAGLRLAAVLNKYLGDSPACALP